MTHSPDVTADFSKNMHSNLKRLVNISISNTKAYRKVLAACSEPCFPAVSILVGDMTRLVEFSTTLNGMIDFAKLSGTCGNTVKQQAALFQTLKHSSRGIPSSWAQQDGHRVRRGG